MAKKYQINLIQQKKKDFTDKIIYFFLHYLRYIIVITQIVVIGVFFFRFQVDQEIIDLKENIQEKEKIFKITRPLIAQVSSLEKSTQNIKKILDRQNQFLDLMDYLFSIIPNNVVLDRLEVDETNIKLTGHTNNIALIKILSERIKKDARFNKVAISQVGKSELGFSFSIKVTPK